MRGVREAGYDSEQPWRVCGDAREVEVGGEGAGAGWRRCALPRVPEAEDVFCSAADFLGDACVEPNCGPLKLFPGDRGRRRRSEEATKGGDVATQNGTLSSFLDKAEVQKK
jgi:hypothetical protein